MIYSKEELEKDLAEFDGRRKQIMDKANSLWTDGDDIVHQDIVVIERIDHESMTSFLNLDPKRKASEQRLRQGWMARILRVSDVPAADEQIQFKKDRAKVGSIVTFNPEGAYSLNIKDFYEIWVISVDAIICPRNDFDFFGLYKESLEKKHEIFG